MNKLIIPFLFIATLFMTSCLNNDEPKDKVQDIRMVVSAETGITYHWGDDKKEYPIECMLVKLPNDPDRWQTMMFGEIEGFTYERGHEYYLSVRQTTLANPPADASCYTYSLIRILSEELLVSPEEPVDKDITSVNDIKYQNLCPFDKYAIETLYYISGDGEITYSDGRQAPSYKSARIYLENVLSTDDPNWITFLYIPYQATYSYVFSPLSDKVRLIRNESSGPMFKNVVPETEFNYIVENLKENDEVDTLLSSLMFINLDFKNLAFILKRSNEASLMKNNMASKAIKFLEAHISETPSRFVEEVTWRKENASWLRWSRQLAITLIGYMQDNGMKRADLASKLGVSPQYVSKLLSGTGNLSLKSIANIEDKLGISCLAIF